MDITPEIYTQVKQLHPDIPLHANFSLSENLKDKTPCKEAPWMTRWKACFPCLSPHLNINSGVWAKTCIKKKRMVNSTAMVLWKRPWEKACVMGRVWPGFSHSFQWFPLCEEIHLFLWAVSGQAVVTMSKTTEAKMGIPQEEDKQAPIFQILYGRF